MTRKNRARKKEILMELQKVNVKDFDPSTLKEGEILDIPRYQELSLVLRALESETIKDNINSEFVEEAKEFVRYWSISTPDFSRDTNEDSARKVTTLGIYYSEDKGFRVMFDPNNLDRTFSKSGKKTNLLPRIGLDFFVEYLDILDIESEDKLLKSLKKRAEESLSRAQNNDEKSAKDVVNSYLYLNCFNNKIYKKEANKKIIKLFKKVIENGFYPHSNEAIMFLMNWDGGMFSDTKSKIKKLSLKSMEQNDDLHTLFNKISFLNKILKKDDLHQCLKDTNVLKVEFLSNIRLLEHFIIINKETFFEVLNVLNEFSLAYQENWLKTEGINGFKFKLLMEYPLYMMKSLYNDFKTYEDCENFSSDLLEGALKFSKGNLVIRFYNLVLTTDNKLFDFISNKGYKYSLVGGILKEENDYYSILDELEKLISDFSYVSSEKLENKKILVPRGAKLYMRGILELSDSYNKFDKNHKLDKFDKIKYIVENNLEEVEVKTLINLKENNLVL